MAFLPFLMVAAVAVDGATFSGCVMLIDGVIEPLADVRAEWRLSRNASRDVAEEGTGKLVRSETVALSSNSARLVDASAVLFITG